MVDLKALANLLISDFKRSPMGKRMRSDDISSEVINDNSINFCIRYFGDWVVPDGEEDDGDYDWETPTDATKKEVERIATAFEEKHNVKIEFSAEEKNNICFTISPRKLTERKRKKKKKTKTSYFGGYWGWPGYGNDSGESEGDMGGISEGEEARLNNTMPMESYNNKNGVTISSAKFDGQHRTGSLSPEFSSNEITKKLGIKPKLGGKNDKSKFMWKFNADGEKCAIWDYRGERWSTYGPIRILQKIFGNAVFSESTDQEVKKDNKMKESDAQLMGRIMNTIKTVENVVPLMEATDEGNINAPIAKVGKFGQYLSKLDPTKSDLPMKKSNATSIKSEATPKVASVEPATKSDEKPKSEAKPVTKDESKKEEPKKDVTEKEPEQYKKEVGESLDRLKFLVGYRN